MLNSVPNSDTWTCFPFLMQFLLPDFCWPSYRPPTLQKREYGSGSIASRDRISKYSSKLRCPRPTLLWLTETKIYNFSYWHLQWQMLEFYLLSKLQELLLHMMLPSTRRWEVRKSERVGRHIRNTNIHEKLLQEYRSQIGSTFTAEKKFITRIEFAILQSYTHHYMRAKAA